jgi:hypothetical protein
MQNQPAHIAPPPSFPMPPLSSMGITNLVTPLPPSGQPGSSSNIGQQPTGQQIGWLDILSGWLASDLI